MLVLASGWPRKFYDACFVIFYEFSVRKKMKKHHANTEAAIISSNWMCS